MFGSPEDITYSLSNFFLFCYIGLATKLCIPWRQTQADRVKNKIATSEDKKKRGVFQKGRSRKTLHLFSYGGYPILVFEELLSNTRLNFLYFLVQVLVPELLVQFLLSGTSQS